MGSVRCEALSQSHGGVDGGGHVVKMLGRDHQLDSVIGCGTVRVAEKEES